MVFDRGEVSELKLLTPPTPYGMGSLAAEL